MNPPTAAWRMQSGHNLYLLSLECENKPNHKSCSPSCTNFCELHIQKSAIVNCRETVLRYSRLLCQMILAQCYSAITKWFCVSAVWDIEPSCDQQGSSSHSSKPLKFILVSCKEMQIHYQFLKASTYSFLLPVIPTVGFQPVNILLLKTLILCQWWASFYWSAGV